MQACHCCYFLPSIFATGQILNNGISDAGSNVLLLRTGALLPVLRTAVTGPSSKLME